ncbi:TVP38/TMEM64 family protein [Actinoplanes utahensis]|uniref:TVP38/TMEM64 family protein n=1 Tax=Actinoplanes utahensis TaxID=1869 RepID=UPI0012698F04|nr:VTT domain-containing protein [Actinoplanes utahensis]GIF32410.1 hypothetical protein Aut01nite_53960 [Actinoplanes utahensis]
MVTSRVDHGDQRRFLALTAGVAVISLAGFGVVEHFDPPFLAEDFWAGGGPAPWAALVGVALLLADVALPVPSSVVMIFLGAVLGLPAGAGLSWAATAGSTMIAFGLGRRLGGRAGAPEALERRLRSHGVLMIALTRPLPVLAETTAVAAGMTRSMTWRRVLIGAVAGTLPPAVLFAAAGASAHGSYGMLLIGLCVLLDGAIWFGERAYRRNSR